MREFLNGATAGVYNGFELRLGGIALPHLRETNEGIYTYRARSHVPGRHFSEIQQRIGFD
jgi:hypothetical protein